MIEGVALNTLTNWTMVFAQQLLLFVAAHAQAMELLLEYFVHELVSEVTVDAKALP